MWLTSRKHFEGTSGYTSNQCEIVDPVIHETMVGLNDKESNKLSDTVCFKIKLLLRCKVEVRKRSRLHSRKKFENWEEIRNERISWGYSSLLCHRWDYCSIIPLHATPLFSTSFFVVQHTESPNKYKHVVDFPTCWAVSPPKCCESTLIVSRRSNAYTASILMPIRWNILESAANRQKRQCLRLIVELVLFNMPFNTFWSVMIVQLHSLQVWTKLINRAHKSQDFLFHLC